MKVLVIVFSLLFSSTVFGQLNSYDESKNTVKMGFDMVFAGSDDAVFIVLGRESFELTTFMARSTTKLESLRTRALEEVSCANCKIFNASEIANPIEHVIDEMEEGDVFVITKKDSNYLVEHYRKE